MLCNKCQVREATVHYTVYTSSAAEEQKRIDFCQECFEASNLDGARPPTTDFQATIQAGCQYCGGEFHSGGFDPLALLGGVHKVSVQCKPCAKEYSDFLRRKFPGFGDCNLTKEQRAILLANLKACDFPAILAELEEHMKQWVAKRKSQ